jgi:hypothetical protein
VAAWVIGTHATLNRIEDAFDTNIRQQGLKVAILPER